MVRIATPLTQVKVKRKAREQGKKLGYSMAEEIFRKYPSLIVDNLIIRSLDTAHKQDENARVLMSPRVRYEYELGLFTGVKEYLNHQLKMSVPKPFEAGFRRGLKQRWG